MHKELERVWQRFSDFKFEEHKSKIWLHSWSPCVVRWPNAMISAAFKLSPSTKSKWKRTEQINSVWLICGFNYMWCKAMIVLGCDSRLLVFSLVTCCSCLSPKEETPFCLFPELNHFRILAGEAAIARGAGGAERPSRVSGNPLTGGEACWSCSLRCGPGMLWGRWGATSRISVRQESHPWICTHLNSRGIWI